MSSAPEDPVVAEARAWLGTPYRHQASLKGVGCDCLGLIRGVWRELIGGEPQVTPAYSSDWAETGREERMLIAAERYFEQAESREPGCLLVFRMRRGALAKHLGICTDINRFIHAYEGACVTESALCNFWQRRIAAVFRFPLPKTD